MTTSARARAEASQRKASDPAVSAFVSASAGSGKTKLLTDRLLRLMLAGAHPGRIQCLTFTRAGAAEMAVRLQARLGRWVTAGDPALDADLQSLDLAPTAPLRIAARQLFARVLDLPGGMRIGTIHAFCQSLLRRFPLEAALSPHFQLLDDSAARTLQSQAREAVLYADTYTHAVATLAPELSLDQFADLLRTLQENRDRLNSALVHGPGALAANQRRILGLSPTDNPDTILAQAVAAMDLPHLRAVFAKAGAQPTNTNAARIEKTLAWLAAAPPENIQDWHQYAEYFLNTDKAPRSPKNVISADAERAYPGTREKLVAEQQRICTVLATLRAAEIAALTTALLDIALPALQGYDTRKQHAGRLDYTDLIDRARALLHIPGAAWVLYKLDGGLDHLLLDEVQDTAPDQWRIADALTAEFFAGQSAHQARIQTTDGAPLPRSIFAVGDHKQSIFSFQGAAPEEFDRWNTVMRDRTRAGGGTFHDVTLDVSFRSTTPVLDLVDAVFKDAKRLGIKSQPTISHIADRADHAGAVELWPCAPRPVPPEPVPWQPPTATSESPSAPQRLAAELAAWISRQTDGSVMLESRGRPLHAGDILVLVRTRGTFDRALLRALKANAVPVAGLDRMTLTDQPAVADLLALCDVLLLPSDDLALATTLTSPIGGLTDDSLMHLALARRTTLWDTLRTRAAERPDWQAAHSVLSALFSRVDAVSPHALLTEALGPLGARARLFARLGPQAAEPIDELLNVALSYAAANPPSLQGFVHWLRQSGAEVKRENEGAARSVRIMTVHGAKGLQAPLVILPATTGLSARKSTLLWAPDPDGQAAVPLWGPRQDVHDTVLARTREQAVDAEREEHYRLLYVALTRAEDRLLICGWETHRALKDSWYELIAAAFDSLCAEPCAGPAWPVGGSADAPVPALRYATPQRAAAVTEPAHTTTAFAPLPAWAGAADGWRPASPPVEPARPGTLAPSRPEASLAGTPPAAPPLAVRTAAAGRFARGTLLHSLLQHLPNIAHGRRAEAARLYLLRTLPPQAAADLAAEALALLDDPALAPLFGPASRAEAPLTALLATPTGPAVIGGLVDRLAILPDRILIADYKTNRDPPADVARTPVLYLGQMAAYRAVLRAIHPALPVQCALIWTRTARVDWLPDALLDAHAPQAHIPPP